MKNGYWIRSFRAKEGAYDTIDNITKFALTDDDYEEYEKWIEIPVTTTISQKINQLKQQLGNTDYVVIKIAEGVATFEEYIEVLEQRKQWRAEINELEAELALIQE